MTREDIKIINDIVHKTIYGFFDVCSDKEETPMTDKDKLLLEVNKAVCNNIKDLEQEPCEDAISRQAALEKIHWLGLDNDTTIKCDLAIRALSPVNTQEPKTGRWILHIDASGNSWHTCPACGHIAYTLTRFCPDCGTRLEAPA